MSLYYLAEGLDEFQIGVVFAVGSIMSPLISTLVGLLADRLTERSPSARHWCLAACVLIGSIAFTVQAVHIPRVSRFVTMLVCKVVTSGCEGSSGILADAITLEGLQDRKMFGQERLYGAVSWAIMHLGLGVLIDMYGRVVQNVLIIFAAILVIVVLMVIGVPASTNGRIQEEEEVSPTKKTSGLAALTNCEDLWLLLKTYFSSKCVVAFFIYAITLGYGMTIVENLLFLLFRELSASNFLCGVSVVVTVVFEIPLFCCSKWLLEKLGVPALLSIAGLCYSFRVVGYTLCPGGWFVLLFEPMHGVTIAAWSTASVELVASITPSDFTATGQAFLNLIRCGLGSTAGNSIGGAIIHTHGESVCYRTSAVVVLFGLLYYRTSLLFAPQNLHAPIRNDDDTLQHQDQRFPQQKASTLPAIIGHTTDV